MTLRSLAACLTVVAALTLTSAFAGSAAGQTGRAAAASGSATFNDPVGDSKGAADITAVTISDDPASGVVVFTVTANGIQGIDAAAEPDVNVWINTDSNGSTGSPAGNEYNLVYWRDTTGAGWDTQSWNGTDWQEAAQTSTMSFSRSGDTLSWRLSKTDLGVTSGFSFYVTAATYDASGNIVDFDSAPDGGTWVYQLSAPPPAAPSPPARPSIGKPSTTPKTATAGKRFTIVFPVTRSDSGEPITNARVTGVVSVRGKAVRHATALSGGVARISLTVPKSAKGKLLKVKVTITLGGRSRARTVTFRVR